MQGLKSSAYLDRKLHFIQGICRYVSLSDSEYKLQPVKVDVIFIKQLGLIIFEEVCPSLQIILGQFLLL